ncbi:serine dehydratase beta chain [Arcanobacterium hippocoleae]
MALSVFDLFSIGIGPSSSHTVGPMRAARIFLASLGENLNKVAKINCVLYGSLGSTGKGHGTDFAVILGLMGEEPETTDPRCTMPFVAEVNLNHRLKLFNKHEIEFHPSSDIEFAGMIELPAHPNGMRLQAFDAAGELLKESYYYSVGGGFVVSGCAESTDFLDTCDDDEKLFRIRIVTQQIYLQSAKKPGFQLRK